MRRIFSVLIVLAILASYAVFPVSAAGADTPTPYASRYISSYDCALSRSSGVGRVFYVCYSIGGTGLMDKIGASQIVVYYSEDGRNWTEQKTYTADVYTNLWIEDDYFYAEDIPVWGIYDYYYKAEVTFYSEKDGGYDTRTVETDVFYLSG